MAMLAADLHGPFAPIIALLVHGDGRPNNAAYFWASGLLSSVLDNGPTYLVFFVVAGGHAATLMEPMTKTLEAISVGAVFMGALTYIGNAPNFMIYALARRARVPMPSSAIALVGRDPLARLHSGDADILQVKLGVIASEAKQSRK